MLVALYFFWAHNLLVTVSVSHPSIIASMIVTRFADLARLARSFLGRYFAKNMTRSMEAVRFTGVVLAAVGAWTHFWWLIPVGVVVLFGWLRGVWLPRSKSRLFVKEGGWHLLRFIATTR
jgi:hypothetical protein